MRCSRASIDALHVQRTTLNLGKSSIRVRKRHWACEGTWSNSSIHKTRHFEKSEAPEWASRSYWRTKSIETSVPLTALRKGSPNWRPIQRTSEDLPVPGGPEKKPLSGRPVASETATCFCMCSAFLRAGPTKSAAQAGTKSEGRRDGMVIGLTGLGRGSF